MPRPHTPSTLWDVVAADFRRRWPMLAGGLVFLVVVDLLQLLIPRFVQRAVDALADDRADAAFLVRIALVISAIALAIAALRFVWRYLVIGFSRLLERDLRNRLFAHLLRLDQPFFERRTTGELMAHVSNDLSVIQMAFGMGVVAAVDVLVVSLAACAFMLAIDVRLTLIVLAPMPVLALCIRKLARMLHTRVSRVQERFSLLTELARATLGAVRLIKAYNLEQFQARHFERMGLAYVADNLAVARVQGLLAPSSMLIGSLGLLLLLYFGGGFVIRGRVSIGAFIAFISYLNMLIWPMMALGWLASVTQRGLTSLRRIHALLSARPEVDVVDAPDTTAPKTVPPGPAHFRARHLTFRYEAMPHPALADIDLELGPGLTGLAGRTGSGKSTLCKLLLRLYPLPPGMLFYKDEDVRALPAADLRKRIAYVSQEPFLFADSLAANIALGRPEATSAEIEEAAKLAAIHDEILALGGYELAIGERGVRLSGGQKQRVALARALLCLLRGGRPMLVIDDGLSAVDVATEREILGNLSARFADRTVLVVSHRVNVLRTCGRIVLLDEGRIAARGGHEDLLAHPLYRAMAEKQGHAD